MSEPIHTYVFDSSEHPLQDRFDIWRTVMSPVYEVLPAHPDVPEDFAVRTETWLLDGMVIGRGSYSPQRTERTTGRIRRDQLDHIRIVVRDRGSSELEADGKRVLVSGQSVLIDDLARPERWSSRGGEALHLYLQRDAIEDLLPGPMQLHGDLLRTGLAGLLADHVRSLVRHLPGMTRDDADAVVASTRHIVAAALGPSARTLGEARPALEATLLRQMRGYIELHLEEGELGVEALVKTYRVSRSAVYRLFERLGGVQSYIKQRRLERARQILSAQPAEHLGRLSEKVGFKSAAHFSREFKAQFGCAPSELGAGARRVPAPDPADPQALELDQWLTVLRG